MARMPASGHLWRFSPWESKMRTISVSGADVSLFHVAARELGDAGQAWRIMFLNGMPDFWLSGPPVDILIPDPDPNQDSIPPQ
jgi:hypothetical protein